jgi:hypothetical protein
MDSYKDSRAEISVNSALFLLNIVILYFKIKETETHGDFITVYDNDTALASIGTVQFPPKRSM